MTVIAAARKSPPVEIVILNYNSTDGLEEYIESLPQEIVHIKYTGNEHYHMAHARNLSMLAGSGKYLVSANSDSLLSEDFFAAIRKILVDGIIWSRNLGYSGILVIQKKEFIDAGGYDERFEFYGPDDKELMERLRRRGGKYQKYSSALISEIRTPIKKKKRGYRLKITRKQMHRIGMEYLEENRKNNLLIANPNGWGERDKIYGCKCNNTGA